MKKIYKFPINFNTTIEMPKGARVLTGQIQHKVPCIWAEVDVDEFGNSEKEERQFIMIGTGHEFPDALLRYISTVQDGSLVWHIYELLGYYNAS